MAFVMLSVLTNDAPAALRRHVAEVPVVSKHDKEPRCLVATATTVKFVDEGTSCMLSGALKTDVLKSLRLYPRKYLLCKLTDSTAPMKRNHMSKFMSSLFDKRPFPVAQLVD